MKIKLACFLALAPALFGAAGARAEEPVAPTEYVRLLVDESFWQNLRQELDEINWALDRNFTYHRPRLTLSPAGPQAEVCEKIGEIAEAVFSAHELMTATAIVFDDVGAMPRDSFLRLRRSVFVLQQFCRQPDSAAARENARLVINGMKDAIAGLTSWAQGHHAPPAAVAGDTRDPRPVPSPQSPSGSSPPPASAGTQRPTG